MHDEECLVMTEDESHLTSDDDVPSPGREESLCKFDVIYQVFTFMG